MLMVSNVYKSNNKTDHQITNIIITGFTGQLKGWWDNTLTDINRIANERDFHAKPLRSRIARTRYPGNVSITRNFYPRPTPPIYNLKKES